MSVELPNLSAGFLSGFHDLCLQEWYNHLKQVTGKPHPNIYEFVVVTHKEQTPTEVSLTQLAAGARPPRCACTESDQPRSKNQERFEGNSITLREFVCGISSHTSI